MQINYIVRKTVLGKGATACKAARELSQTIKTMKSIGTFTKKAAGSKSFSLTKSALTEIEKKTVRDYAPIAFGHVSVLDNIFQGGIIALNVGFYMCGISLHWFKTGGTSIQQLR